LEDSYKELQPTIEIYLHEDYAHLDSLVQIEEELKADYGSINEFYYNKEMLEDINTNSNFLIYIILGIAVLLLIVAIALINNTIRLAIYSKRLNIRSMQLVGATENFIRRPFIWNAFLQGIIAAMLALGLLMGLNLYLEEQIEGLHEIQDLKIIVILFGMVTALGILISWISTYFALRKYLRLKSEYLY
jgi:cell division transport system permease protein